MAKNSYRIFINQSREGGVRYKLKAQDFSMNFEKKNLVSVSGIAGKPKSKMVRTIQTDFIQES